MRNNVNEVYANGQVVDRTVVPWTLEDYTFAIESNPEERETLITERAVLLGTVAMTERIDQVADAKRLQILGDTTRAFEYQAAEKGAKDYEAAGFDGPVPDDVMSWAVASNITPKEAAEDIIREAKLFNFARSAIRAIRLQGKQDVRSAATHEQCVEAYLLAIQKLNSIGQQS